MRRQFTSLALCALVLLAWAAPTLAEASLSLKCTAAVCELTNNVMSVPAGATVSLQAVDDSNPIFDVIWSFDGLGKAYGINAQYQFNRPGKYQANVLIVYKDSAPRELSFTVHVLVAPERNGPSKLPQILGLPNEITYPVLAALALYIVSYLNSLSGG